MVDMSQIWLSIFQTPMHILVSSLVSHQIAKLFAATMRGSLATSFHKGLENLEDRLQSFVCDVTTSLIWVNENTLSSNCSNVANNQKLLLNMSESGYFHFFLNITTYFSHHLEFIFIILTLI